jgi:hypothetical protein
MQPLSPTISMHERTQWSAVSAECILFPQINAQSTAVGYYSACVEKCLMIVRYPYTTLIDDSGVEHGDKPLCSIKVVNLLTG